MSTRAKLFASLSVAASSLLVSNAAFAGVTQAAPGPAVLGLIAAGVVGAIVIARLRK
jgi:hypothetical protein